MKTYATRVKRIEQARNGKRDPNWHIVDECAHVDCGGNSFTVYVIEEGEVFFNFVERGHFDFGERHGLSPFHKYSVVE